MMVPRQALLRAHHVFRQALCKLDDGEGHKVCQLLDLFSLSMSPYAPRVWNLGNESVLALHGANKSKIMCRGLF